MNTDKDAYYVFRIESTIMALPALDVRLHDVHPDITPSLEALVRSWARRFLADALAELDAAGHEALRQSGY